ncbi:MAG: hypothetical protein ABL882_02750 [Sphingopyxis sp.]
MSEAALFADLESSAAFRADMLYFLRLAGNYMANIFVTVRAGAPSKHRKAFAEWLTPPLPARGAQKPSPIEDKPLRDALVTKQLWFDAYKRDFAVMLGEMPQAMKDRLGRSIQADHCLPLDLRNFIAMLDELREYRHWLDHYDERVQKKEKRPVTDEQVARHLGLLLLPHLHNHLIGRVHHHRCKAGQRSFGRPKAAANAELKAIFDRATADRREATMERMGRRTKGSVIRKERQEAQQVGERWRQTHAARFSPDTWPRYNLHNWKTRYYFMGEGRIAKLESQLRPAGDDGAMVDFIHAIEPLFNLSLDLNLAIHMALTAIEGLGIKIRSKKDVGLIIPALRNEIAHGGFFWDVKGGDGAVLAAADVFEAMQGLMLQASNGKQRRNDFVTAAQQLMRKARTSLAFPPADPDDANRSPPPIRVRTWGAGNRVRYGHSSAFRLEKRKDLSRVVAAWMRALASSREKIDSKVGVG